MGMSLHEYLAEEQISPTAWAKKVGIPQPVISRLLAGTRTVSLKTAIRIQEATGGQVRVEDLAESGNGPDFEAQNA
jgi:plasmid maintenance system antidote protein VapI